MIKKELLKDIESKFKEGVFTKKGTMKIFKRYFHGDLEIEVYNNYIMLNNDINFNLELKYNSLVDKRIIYGFIQYMLIVFDFSFTIDITNFKELKETFESFSK